MNVYVKNLDDSIDDKRLEQEFAQFGEITSARVMVDNHERSKGFGFVCFKLPDQATKAITEMNTKIVEGKPLYVALHQPRAIRDAQLAQRFAGRTDFGGRPGGQGYPGNQGGRGMYYGQQQQMQRRPQGGMGYPGQYQQQMGPMPGMGFNSGFATPQGFGQQQFQQPPMGGGYRQRPSRRRDFPPTPGGPAMQQPTPMPNALQTLPVQQQQLNAKNLSQADPQQQKQMIGERIFPLVQQREPKLAGKITGMLLEMDITELLHLFENHAAMNEKINEALAVLREHQIVAGSGGAE